MKRQALQIIAEIISALVILLFVYAAISKLVSYEKFLVQISQSSLLYPLAGFIAWFIPATEIIISVLLVFGRSRLLALYAAFSLMTMFTAYIIAITRFTENIPCSCGGVLEKMGWTAHLYFNIVFIVLIAMAVVITSRARSLQHSQHAVQAMTNPPTAA